MASSYLPSTAVELVDMLGLVPHPEGGFFLETFRSGSAPMVTRGQSALGDSVPRTSLVTTTGRTQRRPDQSNLRNCLTSIFWVPTLQSPRLILSVNCSDHVHYYQGGLPFRYYIYNPETKAVRQEILGPHIRSGQKLQIAVVGGEWKCGCIVDDAETKDHGLQFDYTIVAEAVGPGFDHHDFQFVTKAELLQQPRDAVETLQQFVQGQEDFDDFYDDNQKRAERTRERLG